MKKITVLGLATLALALAGCKSKQERVGELQAEYDMAGSTLAGDCPMVQDAKGSYQQNNSPKCVEERKDYEALHQQLLEAQREASK